VTEEEGLWVTVTELARLRGRDKSVISRRVDRLEAQGLIKTRRGDRGTKLVLVAAFDRATDESTDAIRELNGASGAAVTAPAAPGDPTLAKAQARRADYAADLAKLDLDERLGKVIPVADVLRFHDAAVEEVKRVTSQLPARAEEMGALVAKDGFNGGRDFLRRLGRELDEAFAAGMNALADRLESQKGDAE
jgi:DNA-binding MarR family transcriptional regulator